MDSAVSAFYLMIKKKMTIFVFHWVVDFAPISFFAVLLMSLSLKYPMGKVFFGPMTSSG